MSAEIDRDPERARVRLVGVAVLTGLVVLVGLGARNCLVGRARRCTGDEPQIAEVWGPVQKDSLRAALVGSGLPYAEDTATRVSARFDAYAWVWAAAYREACEDRAVRKKPPRAPLELRLACLEGRRRALAATIAVLHEADATTIEGAIGAALELPAIERCKSASYVRAEHPGPAEAEADAALRQQLARVSALLGVGRARETEVELTAAERFEPPAHLGPTLALLRGRVEQAMARCEPAVAAYERAYQLAQQRENDDIAREAALRILPCIAEDDRHALWASWSRLAEVEIARSGGLRDRLLLRRHRADRLRRQKEFTAATELLATAVEACEADPECQASELDPALREQLGLCHEVLGAGAQALELHQQVLARRTELVGPQHPAVAAALDAIRGVLQALGRPEVAAVKAEQVLAIRLAAYGPDHPRVGEAYNALAGVLLELKQVRRAVEYLRETARIEREQFGADAAQLGSTSMKLGRALHQLDRDEEARVALLEAERIQRATLGPDHADLMVTLALLGGAEHGLGHTEASERYFREALQIAERALPDDDPQVVEVCQHYATLLRELGRLSEALALLRPARDRLAARLGESHLQVASVDTTLGRIEAALGLTAAAEARLRRALAVFERETDVEDRRRLEPMVALASLVLPRDPAEALRLVEPAQGLARMHFPPGRLQAELYETLATALVRVGGRRDEARSAACLTEKALGSEDPTQPALGRLRKLGLFTRPCL